MRMGKVELVFGRGPRGTDRGGESRGRDGDGGDDPRVVAARDLIGAVRDGDAEAVAAALDDYRAACEMAGDMDDMSTDGDDGDGGY